MKLRIREYDGNDLDAVSRLFFETVHSVNAADYTKEQLSAWAESVEGFKARRESDLLDQHTLVAEIGGAIAGFGSIDGSGCLDLLFVHKNFQRKGVATALCDRLERGFSVIKTFASVTARPFFEGRGYTVVEERQAERAGVKLKNYEMRKILK